MVRLDEDDFPALFFFGILSRASSFVYFLSIVCLFSIANGESCGVLSYRLGIGYIWSHIWGREFSRSVMYNRLLGGFTTFSTFSKEALSMLQTESYWSLASYVWISVIAGVALTAVGYALSRNRILVTLLFWATLPPSSKRFSLYRGIFQYLLIPLLL